MTREERLEVEHMIAMRDRVIQDLAVATTDREREAALDRGIAAQKARLAITEAEVAWMRLKGCMPRA
jgi:hypothetical protein